MFYDSIFSQFPKEIWAQRTPSQIDHSRKYHNIPLCLSPPNFVQFSWELKWPQKKLKSMLMQNFGVTNEEYYGMLWYFLECSIKKSDQKASTGCAWLERVRDISIAIAWWVVIITPLTPWPSHEATQHLTHLILWHILWHITLRLPNDAVSIKHGLRTADHGLRTGYKIRTRYKMRTPDWV